MRAYELVMLVSPQVADSEVPQVADRVAQFVKARGGEVEQVNPWGRRRLAYYIDDFEEASYVHTTFKLAPEHTRDLEHSLKLSEEVIRHLLVRLE